MFCLENYYFLGEKKSLLESEKSAIIANAIIPIVIWLAVGNINVLSVENCKVLKNRNVILYPDLGASEKWSTKADEIQKQFYCNITISTLLEEISIPIDKSNGLDVADFTIDHLRKQLKIKSLISKTLSYVN